MEQQPKIYFSEIFRFKLEAMLRLLQQHTTSNLKRHGKERAQIIQDHLFSDMLHILFRIKDDGGIQYTAPDPKEWSIFVQIITEELNHLNGEIQNLFHQQMPDVMILGKFNLYTMSSCDSIVDLLNAEFNFLYNSNVG